MQRGLRSRPRVGYRRHNEHSPAIDVRKHNRRNAEREQHAIGEQPDRCRSPVGRRSRVGSPRADRDPHRHQCLPH